jgi:MFS family permease
MAEAAMSLAALGVRDPEGTAQEIAATAAESAGASVERLSWRRHRRPIMLAVAIAMLNQLSGINAILYYLGDIFGSAGFNNLSANVQSVAIGITNLLATLFAMTIIDRVGRKPLLLFGSVVTSLALAGIATVLALGAARGLLLPLLLVFIAAFAASQGAVIWVYLSEIFPTPVRARGQGIGSATHWVMNALISLTFPAVAAHWRSVPFAFFSLMMLLQCLLVAAFLPETKGIALEHMQRVLGGKEEGTVQVGFGERIEP